jgi:hypothetical protein
MNINRMLNGFMSLALLVRIHHYLLNFPSLLYAGKVINFLSFFL